MSKAKGGKGGLGNVARDTHGAYIRDLGWKENGTPGTYKQHRFYLGRDRAEAHIRVLRLEQMWAAVEAQWVKDGRPTGRPVWDEDTLEIGKAVARGESACKLTLPQWVRADGGDSADAVSWLRTLQDRFPFIRLSLADEQVQKEGEEEWHRTGAELLDKAKEYQEHGNRLLGKRQTLHMALDAFSDACRARYSAHDGTLSPTGQVALKDVAILKAHAPDTSLAAFDLGGIESIISHWQKRPPVKTRGREGKPCAIKTAQNLIKRFRMFLRWLHKCKDYGWRLPSDYEVLPVRFTRNQEERAARLSTEQVKTYSDEELALLWKHAKPRERLLMLLGLNCGFGIAEVASLQTAEIHLRSKHPVYDLSGSFIRRLRGKTDVFGEWGLWDSTVAGIEWYLSCRPQTESRCLLVNKNGVPLAAQTSGGNRAQSIPNDWRKLVKRVRKLENKPDFRYLSFNKLRKTGINAIRQIAGGELAGIFGAHGSAVASDNLLDCYSNKPFAAVHSAIRTWGARLSPIFGAVSAPWEEGKRRHAVPEKFARGRQRVITLRRQGYKLKKIAELTGLSLSCVRNYLEAARHQEGAENQGTGD